ncbi:hypothetical protein O6H91_03G090000 [Diphasiastrum complanatum]|nr:hypothetical protein O6H91_03G090000 [Diphasiastrum complanatum]
MTEKGQMAQSREGECVADYELQRNARVQENKKRMLELGLTNLSETLAKDGRSMGLTNGVVRSNAKTAPRLPTPHLLSSPTPTRRSSRLQSTPALCYKELSEKDICSGSISNSGGYPHLQPEYYTKEHEVLLGSYNAEWELFKDGYGSDGVRIYDSVRGKTCHQCRQKTLGLRTWCNNCESLQGQFCGDCLIMRYGENLLEVNQKKNWKCPSCRGICNCSICRIRKGWSPTGSLYKKAVSLGYKSVAHYLILSRQTSVNEGSNGGSDSSTTKLEDHLRSAPPVRRLLDFKSQEEKQIVELGGQQKPDALDKNNAVVLTEGQCMVEPTRNERRKSMLSEEDNESLSLPIGFVNLENADECKVIITDDKEDQVEVIAGNACDRTLKKVKLAESNSLEVCTIDIDCGGQSFQEHKQESIAKRLLRRRLRAVQAIPA